ncbi:MAG TPA: hypothetical protein VGQ99_10600 [Tepidisphaeraceae bacterium]|jgi:hypothetical protein|nr:hypothetical protein [Tepidisphaeraceae bacterium]
MNQAGWELRTLEEEWWRWRILRWLRDSLLFTWVVGALLMVFDREEVKAFGFWLLWLGLAGWPIIMVLGWRWQVKARAVEEKYRPYTRGWLSWQAVGWVVIGLVMVFYMRSYVTPAVITFSRERYDTSVELADGRVIFVKYIPAPARLGGVINVLQVDPEGGRQNLEWKSLRWELEDQGKGPEPLYAAGETAMRHVDGRMLKCNYCVVPVAALLPFGLIWVAAWAIGIRRVEARRKANRCPNCGYDLRESPQQCPECGMEVMRFVADAPMEMERNS